MNRNQRKTARERSHVEMMKSFYAYIDTLHDRPSEGGLQWQALLDAFKAGWKAA